MKKSTNSNYSVKLDNMPIERVIKAKFLGIFIDDKLSWKYHINEVENKVARSIGIITKMKSLFPDMVLRSLYCSLVLPYFQYCNIAWGNTYPTNLKKLTVLQKKAIRRISHSSPRARTSPLFTKLNLLNLECINNYQQCVFMYKYMYNSLPSSFNNLFNLNRNLHRYNTRSCSNFHLPKHRTTSYHHNIRFSGPINWNNLPSNLKEAKTLHSFKRKLKSYLNRHHYYNCTFLVTVKRKLLE